MGDILLDVLPGSATNPLDTLLRTIAKTEFREEVGVAAGLVEDLQNHLLFSDELPSIQAVAARRRRTFIAGRACAHAALSELGLEPRSIPSGRSGLPVWPPNVLGSISHTDRFAAAIVSNNASLLALGLDVEGDEPFEDGIAVGLVSRPEELRPGLDPSHHSNLERGKLLFVIKEAIYKAYYPRYGSFLEFHDVRVSINEERGTFDAEVLGGPRFQTLVESPLRGRFAFTSGLIVAICSQQQNLIRLA